MTLLPPTLAFLAIAVGCEKQAAAQDWEEATAAAVSAQARADYAEARQHLDRASLLAADFPPDDPRRARTIHNRASIAHLTGDYTAAEQGYRQALEMLRVNPSPVDLTRALKNLAVLLKATGRTHLAQVPLKEAIALAGRYHVPGRAAMYYDLAEIHRTSGDPAAAVHAIDAAMEAEHGEPDPKTRALLRQSRGLLAIDAGKWDEAESHLRQARGEATAAYGVQHPIAAGIANNLGQVLLKKR
jgi:tetratricopeptide (TPR) repeat protein